MAKVTSKTNYRKGEYSVVVNIVTGTAKLQMQVNDNGSLSALTDIDNASWTGAGTAILTVPACAITPVLTGDAEVFIDEVRRL
jgi:hypothetical protein